MLLFRMRFGPSARRIDRPTPSTFYMSVPLLLVYLLRYYHPKTPSNYVRIIESASHWSAVETPTLQHLLIK